MRTRHVRAEDGECVHGIGRTAKIVVHVEYPVFDFVDIIYTAVQNLLLHTSKSRACRRSSLHPPFKVSIAACII